MDHYGMVHSFLHLYWMLHICASESPPAALRGSAGLDEWTKLPCMSRAASDEVGAPE
jgi:hypothetical protein